MCISGFTSLQRGLWESANAGRIGKVPWMLIGSGNKLIDLHQLYCGGDVLDKSMVKIFVEGKLDDVRENFQVFKDFSLLLLPKIKMDKNLSNFTLREIYFKKAVHYF